MYIVISSEKKMTGMKTKLLLNELLNFKSFIHTCTNILRASHIKLKKGVSKQNMDVFHCRLCDTHVFMNIQLAKIS